MFDHINGVIFSKIISRWKLSFTLIFVMFCDSNTFVAIMEAIRRLTSQYLWSFYIFEIPQNKPKRTRKFQEDITAKKGGVVSRYFYPLEELFWTYPIYSLRFIFLVYYNYFFCDIAQIFCLRWSLQPLVRNYFASMWLARTWGVVSSDGILHRLNIKTKS